MIIGLVVGKPVGLVAATWIAVKCGAGRPVGVTWQGIWAIGRVAGIGFTVVLFVTGPLGFLAFKLQPVYQRPPRTSILQESLDPASGSLSGVLASRASEPD